MEKIEDFVFKYSNAVWEKDSNKLLNLYDSDAIQFDMWDVGFYANLSKWTPGIQHWLASLGDERVEVRIEVLQKSESINMGFISGFIQFTAISIKDEKLRTMKNRITAVFMKKQDSWKVVHQHISAPIDSKNFTAILDI